MTFEEQVAEAVVSVQHTNECVRHFFMSNPPKWFCSCDRDARLANRITMAIRAAHGSQGWKAAEHLDHLALKALRGEP